MFTGIVEEVGQVLSITKKTDAIQLSIKASEILNDTKLGDSIAINGVCLTVTSFSKNGFDADVMPETIMGTTLKWLKPHHEVNLERAMSANGRFGGHFMTGHIDGVGQIKQISKKGNAIYMTIQADPQITNRLVLKGSVAVDGTSLTLFDVTATSFTISLIPHSAEFTILGKKRVGDHVNVECDVLQKYVNQEKAAPSSSITMDFLAKHGFTN
ncbi:riboflavin synthase [Terrilactibacillus sp. BCM23-1]|uniref:Riboflavin synthase n=1 Tax=Terrilactibacillus tamarindi TaxID=2599694 RepID=A0A6N8CPY7_9BACI|nr:riboflavin synthase [Terrilactibacillus tamarindi]MTT32091.1 riboflavin synthase [Terrilactibacillus tamarindi]